MTLTNVYPWIRRAFDEGWAVGAFNAVNMEQAQAIAWAAQAESAPAIIQVSHRALLYAGEGDAQRGLERGAVKRQKHALHARRRVKHVHELFAAGESGAWQAV